MLKRFLPRQDKFFDLFQKSAELLVLCATEFQTLLKNPENQQQSVDAISQYEDEGDKVAHATFQLLHKTFITPFDRNDIHRLTSQLDDVLDLINRCALRFPFYNLKIIPNELIELSGIAYQCTVLLKKAIFRLHTLQRSEEILSFCEEIDTWESQANIILLAGEKHLFAEENDFKHFHKINEIYSRTKSVINRCQDVANIIKGIVLEYS
jgi:uncharacterized protein Yka (UPF0111/DUF47 family)